MSFLWVLPLFAYLCVAWHRWIRRTWRVSGSKWRSICGVLGLSLGSVSVLLFIGTAVWAGIRGGFAFHDFYLLLIYRLGAGVSVVGLISATLSGMELRKPGLISSATMLLTWLLVATGE